MRFGPWFQTHTGKKFYPLDPRPEDICLEDIAHALSLICRYNGHVSRFYSVAEHSIIMATSPDLPGSPFWRLMHDAAETYISDIPKPIKGIMYYWAKGGCVFQIKEVENLILSLIGTKFNLGPFPKDDIKTADAIMLATEKRDLITDGPKWDLPDTKPLYRKILSPGYTPTYAKLLFLDLAKEFMK